MLASTEYFWRVDIVHAGGTETGAVYSFTTNAMTISDPSPADNATGQDTSVGLAWTNPDNDTGVSAYIEVKDGTCSLEVGDKFIDDQDVEVAANGLLLTKLGLTGQLTQ